MDKLEKREIINIYKQQEIEMGIIQIYNKVTGYSFVDICSNLYKPFEGIKFQLNLGRFKVKSFQEEWNKYGEGAFNFEIVEKLDNTKGLTEKEKINDLKELLEMWVHSQGENLKLYGNI